MEKRESKVLKIILIVLGVVAIFYGFGVNAIVSSNNWFNFAFCYFGIALIVFAFFLRWIKGWKLWGKIVLVILIICAILNFTIAEVKIISAANAKPQENAKWVIVLGAKVNKNGVSLEFGRRINAAYQYALDNPSSFIVVTGGQGKDEPCSEGKAAKDMLISLGISEDRIVLEEKSTSTIENLNYAKKLMEDKGYKDGDSVVIVSSSFHLYRAKLLAEKEGFNNVSCLGVVGKAFLLPHYYVREYCAVAFEGL